MKVSTERIEGSRVVLNVEVDAEEVERSLDRAYRRLVQRTNIPGFRRGKAPRNMLERYIGKTALMEDALESLVPETYKQAIQEHQIDVIAQPDIEITQTEPVVFKATVAVRPTVELGDYRQIRLNREPVEITEEQVDAVLEQLRFQQGEWVPVERPVKLGDNVTIDVESSIDGEPFVNEEGLQYLDPSADSPIPVPGFAEQLEGMERGVAKEFQLSFPADYAIEEHAGKTYSFKVVVNEVKERVLPELDDEFAKGVGDGFESLDALRQRLSEDLKARVEEGVRRQFEDRVVEAVVGLAQVDIPDILVEREVDLLIDEETQQFRLRGGRLEDYLRNIKKTEAELRDGLQPLARQRVLRSLVLGKVAEEEGIEVSSEEVEAEIGKMVEASGEEADTLRRIFDSPSARQSMERALFTRKTVQRLAEIASAEDAASEDAGTDEPGNSEGVSDSVS